MKDIIYEFLDYIVDLKNYSEFTEINYEIDLFRFAKYLSDNHLSYLNISYQEISNYLISLNKAGYKSSTINRNISTLKSFYSFLEKNHSLKSNPFSLINSVKTEKRLPNYFKYDEFEKLIDVIKDTPLGLRNKVILELLLATGMRVSELANVKINDIDLVNREIKVIGKGNKERIVYFKDYALDALEKYLKNGRDVLLSNNNNNDYLLLNQKGNNLSSRGIRYIIENIVLEASVKSKISPHTFRHTFATMLLNEGCDIRSVQELLGHSSLSTTGIYTHLTNDNIKRVYLNAHPRARK